MVCCVWSVSPSERCLITFITPHSLDPVKAQWKYNLRLTLLQSQSQHSGSQEFYYFPVNGCHIKKWYFVFAPSAHTSQSIIKICWLGSIPIPVLMPHIWRRSHAFYFLCPWVHHPGCPSPGVVDFIIKCRGRQVHFTIDGIIQRKPGGHWSGPVGGG